MKLLFQEKAWAQRACFIQQRQLVINYTYLKQALYRYGILLFTNLFKFPWNP
jgi:hypothetical protein